MDYLLCILISSLVSIMYTNYMVNKSNEFMLKHIDNLTGMTLEHIKNVGTYTHKSIMKVLKRAGVVCEK